MLAPTSNKFVGFGQSLRRSPVKSAPVTFSLVSTNHSPCALSRDLNDGEKILRNTDRLYPSTASVVPPTTGSTVISDRLWTEPGLITSFVALAVRVVVMSLYLNL